MSTDILMIKLIEALVLKCRYIYDEVDIDIDDEVLSGDDEEFGLEIEDEADSENDTSVVKDVKDEVDVRVDDSSG